MPVLLKYWLDVSDSHAVIEILLVGQNKKWNTWQVLVLYHLIEQIFRLVHAIPVIRVYHINHTVAFIVVLKVNINQLISGKIVELESSQVIPEIRKGNFISPCPKETVAPFGHQDPRNSVVFQLCQFAQCSGQQLSWWVLNSFLCNFSQIWFLPFLRKLIFPHHRVPGWEC